jgi:hypothetical protein
MGRLKFRGIAATTHVDLHGDQFTKEALEKTVEEFYTKNEPVWGFWNHQVTLPPITVVTSQEVKEAGDGEYQLVVEGEFFEEKKFELLEESGLVFTVLTEDVLEGSPDLPPILAHEYLEIIFDPRNFRQNDAKKIITSINEVVETKSDLIVRKAEIPQPILYVLVAFAGGFIARYGEMVADKSKELAKELLWNISNRFNEFLSITKTQDPIDVVFGIPISNSDIVVEGCVEGATNKLLSYAWAKLPELSALGQEILIKNRSQYFRHLNFLLNPETLGWEVNYLTIRESNRIILGPRYSDPTHPLRKRWENDRSKYNPETLGNVGLSVGFKPTKVRVIDD